METCKEIIEMDAYFLKTTNWRKMHGIHPAKNPRVFRLEQGYYSNRSKKKKARYHRKHTFNPMLLDIKDKKVQKFTKRYMYEPKKLKRKLKRIVD